MFINKIIFVLIFGTVLSSSERTVEINPTGTYKLDVKTTKKNGETYGYFGTIRVKRINKELIALTLFISKGAPSYNLGSLLDTIPYINNSALYANATYDSTCKIQFWFTQKGVTVEQTQANLNYGCGFGHGVFADGYYKKTSSAIPEIADPNEE